jgi:hypothetical protein
MVSLVLVVLLGLAVVFLIDTNPYILRARLVADLPTITVSWLLIASLVIITSAGADLLARSHPQMQTRDLPVLNLGLVALELAPGFWIIPSFTVISSFAFFRLFSGALEGAAFVLALIAAGGLLLAVLVCQHYALDRNPALNQQARLGLQVIAYLLAFGCFSAVYYTRLRTLYSAALIGAAGTLLAYALLQWWPRRRVALQATLVGLTLGEVTWALNYWPAPFLLGGTLLLVIFYLMTSLLQHQAAGALQRRLLIEYGLLGSTMLAAVVWATFR